MRRSAAHTDLDAFLFLHHHVLHNVQRTEDEAQHQHDRKLLLKDEHEDIVVVRRVGEALQGEAHRVGVVAGVRDLDQRLVDRSL